MINEMLGIKYPIFQGAMANISTAEFAADVSNSGALGIIGTGAMDAKMVRDSIRKCKELTDKPFGVNIMLMNPYCDEIIEVILEEKVAVVTTGAGNPGKYFSKLNEHGVKIIPVVPSVAQAIRMERNDGVVAMIAEGAEAGGHVGVTNTMSLIPQIVDAVSLPVIAAGGIADGKRSLPRRKQPVSGTPRMAHRQDGRHQSFPVRKIIVPVNSLCPCGKT